MESATRRGTPTKKVGRPTYRQAGPNNYDYSSRKTTYRNTFMTEIRLFKVKQQRKKERYNGCPNAVNRDK